MDAEKIKEIKLLVEQLNRDQLKSQQKGEIREANRLLQYKRGIYKVLELLDLKHVIQAKEEIKKDEV